MKNVTVTMNDALLRKARIEAAKEGKSLSKFVAEAVDRRLDPTTNRRDGMERFLSGPLMDLTDDKGSAPSRDEIYARSRIR